MIINNVPQAELDATYNSLIKYVKQYITNGRLTSRFDMLETDEIIYGNGFEINIVFGATANPSDTKYAEHALYKAKIMTIISTEDIHKQYAVTINDERLARVVGDDAKLREYAAELANSLYQGWIRDKNAAVYSAVEKVANGNAIANVTITEDNAAYASALLAAAKAQVETLREGVTGTSYGNTYAGDAEMAADNIVMFMSPTLAAMLDVYGFAKVFDSNYLQVQNVERVVTRRMPENTILITDARNVQVHRRWEKFVDIPNSDGSRNLFLNVSYRVDGMVTAEGVGAFPYIVIKGVEPTPTAEEA